MLEYTVLIISALVFTFTKIPSTEQKQGLPVQWDWLFKVKNFPSILLFLYGIIVTLNVMVTGEILNPIGTTITTLILRVAVHMISILHLKLQQLAAPSLQDKPGIPNSEN